MNDKISLFDPKFASTSAPKRKHEVIIYLKEKLSHENAHQNVLNCYGN